MDRVCPKCGGRMESGLAAAKGAPELLFHIPDPRPTPAAVQAAGPVVVPAVGTRTWHIRAIRCSRCGYLEFFAPDRAD